MKNYDVELWEETAEQIENNIREDIKGNFIDYLVNEEIIEDFLNETFSDSIPHDCENTHSEWCNDVLWAEISKEIIVKINNALRKL